MPGAGLVERGLARGDPRLPRLPRRQGACGRQPGPAVGVEFADASHEGAFLPIEAPTLADRRRGCLGHQRQGRHCLRLGALVGEDQRDVVPGEPPDIDRHIDRGGAGIHMPPDPHVGAGIRIGVDGATAGASDRQQIGRRLGSSRGGWIGWDRRRRGMVGPAIAAAPAKPANDAARQGQLFHHDPFLFELERKVFPWAACLVIDPDQLPGEIRNCSI
ncbi:hypothetical protein D3C86_1347530 [compost metagenome]